LAKGVFKTVDSPLCLLCKTDTDTFQHFLFYCPIKRDIWWTVISTYFPGIIFNPGEILDSVMNLTPPKIIPRSQIARLYTAVGITHWVIWIQYWQRIIDHQAFQPINAISKIDQHLSLFSSTILHTYSLFILFLIFPILF
jgi:hypothetical protein